jgi:hypothetical protein
MILTICTLKSYQAQSQALYRYYAADSQSIVSGNYYRILVMDTLNVNDTFKIKAAIRINGTAVINQKATIIRHNRRIDITNQENTFQDSLSLDSIHQGFWKDRFVNVFIINDDTSKTSNGDKEILVSYPLPLGKGYNVDKDSVVTRKTDPLFSLHGSITTIGQLSDNKYQAQTIPQNYIRTSINAELTLFGLPFSTNYYYTTENTTGLNQINNYRISFNYNKFYNNLNQRLNKKIQNEKQHKLNTITTIDIKELDKEYSEIKGKVTNQEYLKQQKKNEAIIKRGENDSIFRNSYKYKKSQLHLKDHELKNKRLCELDTLRIKYFRDARNADVYGGILNINSTSPKGFRRSLKKYGLISNADKLALSLKKFDLGTFDPNYTRLVLGGVSLTGVNTEINYGKLYGAFTWGTSVTNFSNPFNIDIAGKRNLISSRVGLGRTEKLLFAFSFLKGSDGASNKVEDSTYRYYVPQQNYVAGIDLVYRQGVSEVGFEFARAINDNQDQNNKSNIEQFGSINKVKYANAWTIYSDLSIESGTRFRLMTRVVDPFYYSFGTPFLRRDNFRIETSIDQSFLNRNVQFGVTYRRDEDNIYDLKEGTSINNSFLFNLQLRFRNYPFVLLTYSPNYQYYYYAASKTHYSSNVKLYNITIGYTKRKRNYTYTSTFTYTKQYNETNTLGFGLFHIDQYSANENLYFNIIDLTTSLGLTYTHPYHTTQTGKIYALNSSLSKSIFKRKVNINGGYSYQKDFGLEERNIIHVGTEFLLGWSIRCNIRTERHFVKRNRIIDNTTNQDMNLGRITIIKTF